MSEINTRCCIVGGGPAGLFAGYLLARAGIDVTVLEKHSDFFRDFRGDTVHPSTLQLMHELGFLEELLSRKHQRVSQLGFQVSNEYITFADFSYLNTKCRFVAFMPQWDFLDFLAQKAANYPSFSLMMNTEATGLIEDNGKIAGVIAKTKDGELHINADLVIGADGRHSIIRQAAKLEVMDKGAPMDVLWMRLSRKNTDPPQTLGRVQAGIIFVMLNRDEYWQCGLVIAKGKLDEFRSLGLDMLHQRIIQIAPFLADRVNELASWDNIKLLTVKVDRLRKWYKNGLLCIGDAAHAMSPIGGVGINLAIQDAVATANALYKPLLVNKCFEENLKMVQDRRMYPTVMTQKLQIIMQNYIIKPTLASTKPISLPWFLKLLNKWHRLRAIPATIFGMGFRPEHIRTPNCQ